MIWEARRVFRSSADGQTFPSLIIGTDMPQDTKLISCCTEAASLMHKKQGQKRHDAVVKQIRTQHRHDQM